MIDIYKHIEKSIKIELVYVQGASFTVTYNSEIENVLDEKIFVKLPENAEFPFVNIPVFAKLNIIIYSQDGVVTGNVNLLKIENNCACISFPYNNQFCQRREDTRIPMHLNFELEVWQDNEISEKFLLKSKNISGKGLASITTEPLPDFQSARLTLFFDNNEIEATCRKVYSKEIILNDRVMFINGIAFTEISKEDVRTIIKNCMKFQIESQHNERLFESL